MSEFTIYVNDRGYPGAWSGPPFFRLRFQGCAPESCQSEDVDDERS
jgi:hypothetical protein